MRDLIDMSKDKVLYLSITKFKFMDGRSRTEIFNKYAFLCLKAGLKIVSIIYVKTKTSPTIYN